MLHAFSLSLEGGAVLHFCFCWVVSPCLFSCFVFCRCFFFWVRDSVNPCSEVRDWWPILVIVSEPIAKLFPRSEISWWCPSRRLGKKTRDGFVVKGRFAKADGEIVRQRRCHPECCTEIWKRGGQKMTRTVGNGLDPRGLQDQLQELYKLLDGKNASLCKNASKSRWSEW